jgi:hypothetical protein
MLARPAALPAIQGCRVAPQSSDRSRHNQAIATKKGGKPAARGSLAEVANVIGAAAPGRFILAAP